MATKALAVVGHVGPAAVGDAMSLPHALSTLAALGQPTRLEIFRLLMRQECGGLLPALSPTQSVVLTTRCRPT